MKKRRGTKQCSAPSTGRSSTPLGIILLAAAKTGLASNASGPDCSFYAQGGKCTGGKMRRRKKFEPGVQRMRGLCHGILYMWPRCAPPPRKQIVQSVHSSHTTLMRGQPHGEHSQMGVVRVDACRSRGWIQKREHPLGRARARALQKHWKNGKAQLADWALKVKPLSQVSPLRESTLLAEYSC